MQRSLILGSQGLLDTQVGNPITNLVLNGDFQIAQRGTSFPAIASGNYSLDRWAYKKTGSMVHTIAQDASVPAISDAGQFGGNSLLMTCTTAQANLAAADYAVVHQPIEGYFFQAIAQQVFTISFWVKASIIGTYSVSLINSGLDRSCTFAYTINAANTWEKKTITVPASPSGGTWNYTNGAGLYLVFATACGATNRTATLGTWQTGVFYAASAQVNGCATANAQFSLALVKVELGATPTTFLKRFYSQEYAWCCRYFWACGYTWMGLAADNRYSHSGTISFPSVMRTVPTLKNGAFLASTGNAGVPGATNINQSNTGIYNTGSNWTQGAGIAFSGQFDSELIL